MKIKTHIILIMLCVGSFQLFCSQEKIIEKSVQKQLRQLKPIENDSCDSTSTVVSVDHFSPNILSSKEILLWKKYNPEGYLKFVAEEKK